MRRGQTTCDSLGHATQILVAGKKSLWQQENSRSFKHRFSSIMSALLLSVPAIPDSYATYSEQEGCRYQTSVFHQLPHVHVPGLMLSGAAQGRYYPASKKKDGRGSSVIS